MGGESAVKLSIGMIYEEFKEYDPIVCYHDYDQKLTFERYLFYDGDLNLHADTLYVFTPSMTSSVHLGAVSIEEGTCLLFLGNKKESGALSRTAFMSISSSAISAEKLSNRLWKIFERYRRIDESLQACIRSRSGLQKLVDIATPLFTNEITIRDSNYRYVAHSYKFLRYSRELQPDSRGYFAPEELTNLKNSPFYQEQVKSPKVWMYTYENRQMICRDIYDRERFLYRIKIIDTNHPFRSFDRALAQYFSDLTATYCLKTPSADETEHVRTFISLAENEHFTVDRPLQELMDEFHWNRFDTYLVFCLRSGKNIGDVSAYSYYCITLNNTFPSGYSFVYQNQIIFILNLTKNQMDSRSLDLKISEFIRDENYRAGCSMKYSDLLKTTFYCRQAVFALDSGLRYNPTLWSCHFKDYRFHYILDALSRDFNSGSYLLPELQALLDYDRSNSARLFPALEKYLEYDGNVSQAAKALNIHRSTLLYRLEKIASITSIDLEDHGYRCLLSLFIQLGKLDEHFFR